MRQNLKALLRIFHSIPVGSATVERSFSGMNRVLSYSRNSLDSALVSDFMVLSLNKDILKNIDEEDIVNAWTSRKIRKLRFD